MSRNKNKQNQRQNGFFGKKLDLHPDISHSITGVIFIVLSLFLSLVYFNIAGPVGSYFHDFFRAALGYGFIFLPLTVFAVAIVFFRVHKINLYFPTIFGGALFLLGALGLLDLVIKSGNFANLVQTDIRPGGYIGFAANWPLKYMFGNWASGVILFAIFATGAIITFNISLKKQIVKNKEQTEDEEDKIQNAKSKEYNKNDKEEMTMTVTEETIEEIKEKEDESEKRKAKSEKYKQQAENNKTQNESFGLLMARARQDDNYQSPPLDLLAGDEETPFSGDAKAYSSIIQRTLATFGIDVEMGEVNVGPTVTQYTLKPAQGVKLSRITALQSDLSLALAAHPIRIEAPIPGRPLVGIEIPNKIIATVRLKNLLADEKINNTGSSLAFALGRDVSGQSTYADMAKMPHLLIAGSTGSGKSVAVHTILTSLIYRNHPKFLKFLLIDPKRVELNIYNGIPHLLAPVVVDREKAINALRWAVKEMDKRYQILSDHHCRDIVSYNSHILKDKNNEELMPYIVIVVDELADLMMVHGREVEGAIVRLAQLARAVGLHLVISTQRPSVEVITGLIKANIASRIALRVASQVDSRTILDSAGAEKLLGSGDMLFMFTDATRLRRIQGCFVSEKEVKKVTDFLRKNYVAEELTETINLEEPKNNRGAQLDFNNSEDNEEDEFFEDAKLAVIQAKKASATLLQRKLRIGYARAARLLDLLENAGIVGPGNGAAPRQVYIDEIGTEDGNQDRLNEI